MRRLALAFVLVLPVFADEPPSWEEFEAFSADKSFVAQVKRDPASAGKEPWEAEWVLSVFRANVGKADGAAAWTAAYQYSGYRGGFLSDDGKYFVYRETWYRHFGTGVAVYSADRKVPTVFRAADFAVNRTALQATASHFLWLHENQPASPFDNGGAIFIFGTIDSGRHAILLGGGEAAGIRSGPFRMSLTGGPRVLRVGEPVSVSVSITNVLEEGVAVAVQGAFHNHWVRLYDSEGKGIPLSEAGKSARSLFGTPNAKMATRILASRERHQEFEKIDLLKHFEVTRPGRYSLFVDYEGTFGGQPAKVSTQGLSFAIAGDAFATPQDLADWVATALDVGDEARLSAVIPEKHRPKDWFKLMVEGHKKTDYRFRSEKLIGREGEAHVLIEPADHEAPTISCVRMTAGWVVEEVTLPR